MTENQLNNSPEIWKAIPGFEGYEASTHGRIRSFWRKTAPTSQGYEPGWVIDTNPRKILRGGKTQDGYPNVQLRQKGNRMVIRVHQLVLITFIGPCPQGMQACHGDGIPANCFLENLRWDTPTNNCLDKCKHGTQLYGDKIHTTKLKESQVVTIRNLASQGYGGRQLGRMFSVSHANIQAILRRQTWKHI